jgi:hypothetical protein
MQSAKHSLIEVLLNIGTGFIISALLQQYVVAPIWHLPPAFRSNLEITVFFTVVSVIRSYVFRRIANRIGHPK